MSKIAIIVCLYALGMIVDFIFNCLDKSILTQVEEIRKNAGAGNHHELSESVIKTVVFIIYLLVSILWPIDLIWNIYVDTRRKED